MPMVGDHALEGDKRQRVLGRFRPNAECKWVWGPIVKCYRSRATSSTALDGSCRE